MGSGCLAFLSFLSMDFLSLARIDSTTFLRHTISYSSSISCSSLRESDELSALLSLKISCRSLESEVVARFAGRLYAAYLCYQVHYLLGFLSCFGSPACGLALADLRHSGRTMFITLLFSFRGFLSTAFRLSEVAGRGGIFSTLSSTGFLLCGLGRSIDRLFYFWGSLFVSALVFGRYSVSPFQRGGAAAMGFFSICLSDFDLLGKSECPSGPGF